MWLMGEDHIRNVTLHPRHIDAASGHCHFSGKTPPTVLC